MKSLNKTAIAVVVALAMVGCKSSGGGKDDTPSVPDPVTTVVIVEPVPEPIPNPIHDLEFGIITPIQTLTGTSWVNGDEFEADALLQEYIERQPHGYVETLAFSGEVYVETVHQNISDTAGRTVVRAFETFFNADQGVVSVALLHGIKCDAEVVIEFDTVYYHEEWYEDIFHCSDGGTITRNIIVYVVEDHGPNGEDETLAYIEFAQRFGNGEMYINATDYVLTPSGLSGITQIQVELTPNATVKYSAVFIAEGY